MSQLSHVVYQPIQKIINPFTNIYLILTTYTTLVQYERFFKDIISTTIQTCLSKVYLINTSLDRTISRERQQF